jgi:hypothetical protein
MTSSAPDPGERIRAVHLGTETLSVDLVDGRSIAVPLAWFPWLLNATPEERGNWEITGGGTGIHWPDLDEDVSADSLLHGAPAPGESRSSDT